MESMLALATSHARLNLRSTVAIVDVLVAIVATEESIASIAYHATKSAPAATSKRVSAAAVATDLWGGTEMCKTVLSKLTRHNQTDDIFIHAYEGAAPRFKCLNMFREILHLVRDSR